MYRGGAKQNESSLSNQSVVACVWFEEEQETDRYTAKEKLESNLSIDLARRSTARLWFYAFCLACLFC